MAGLDDISVANYTKLKYGEAGSEVTITKVQSIGELTDEKSIIDVQEYGVAYLRKLVGTANAGPMEVLINLDPSDATHQYMINSYKLGTRERFTLELTNAAGDKGDSVVFNGFVGSKSLGNDFDSARTVSLSIAIDGAVGDLVANA